MHETLLALDLKQSLAMSKPDGCIAFLYISVLENRILAAVETEACMKPLKPKLSPKGPH